VSLSAIASLSYWFTLQPRVIIAAVGAEPAFFCNCEELAGGIFFIFTFLSGAFLLRKFIKYVMKRDKRKQKNNAM
jgi:hypothetical protein